MNVKGDYSLVVNRAPTESRTQDGSEDLLDKTIADVEDCVEEVTYGWIHLFFEWIESIFRMCWPKAKDD